MRMKIVIRVGLISILVVYTILLYNAISVRHKRETSFRRLEYAIKKRIGEYSEKIGYVIKDLKSGVTIKHNADKKFPAASLIKVPIMMAILQAEKDGFINLHDKMKMKRSHKAPGSGKLRLYRSGLELTVDTLIELMIVESDNTATNILTEFLGFDYINQYLKKLGLKFTRMNRGIMDLQARDRGVENYTTPEEMAYILELIYRKKAVCPEASGYMLSILSRQKIQDRIPRYLPDYVVVAHKTGLMRDVCHDAGILFTDEGDILICVLTEDMPIKLAKKIISFMAYKTYFNL